jgi:HK97 family phage major capsid protein
MKSIELKELRSETLGELEVIQKTAEAEENRDLTEEENTTVDALLAKADDYASKIERAEKIEKSLRESALISGVAVEPKADKDLEKFTFQGAMRAAYSGNVSGIYKEMDQEARSQARYTGQSFKGVGIPSSVLTRAWATSSTNSETTMSFTDQLESNLVLTSAGANFYAGINDMKFPVFGSVSSSWVAETGGSSVSAAGALSAVTLTPKKLISVVSMSQESIVQNPSLEAALRGNIAANMSASLEQALLLSASDETNGPESIFRDAAAGSTAAFTGATASTLENTYIGNDGTYEGARMAYLMDSDAYAAIKQSAMISNVSAAYDFRDKTINGIYAFVSSNVATDGTGGKEHVLFGDFTKVHIAQFGGLDFLFDPYTNADTGEPRMVVTGLFDGDAVQNATAFANLIEA